MKLTIVFVLFALAVVGTEASKPGRVSSKDTTEYIPEEFNPEDVGDFHFYQGPFANLIKSIQNIFKRPEKQLLQNSKAEETKQL